MKEDRKTKTFLIVMIILFATLLYFGSAYSIGNRYAANYDTAIELLKNDEFDEALEIFVELGDYRDSADYVENIDLWKNYATALQLYKNEEYSQAASLFLRFGDFRDSIKKASECASELAKAGDYEKAIEIFEYLGETEESKKYTAELNVLRASAYDVADRCFKEEKFKEALSIFLMLKDYSDSKIRAEECQDILNRKELGTIISAGTYSVLGIKNDKTAIHNQNIYNLDISTWNNLVSVSLGTSVAIGLQMDGSIFTSADGIDLSKVNSSDGIKEWEDFDDIIAVSAGNQYVVALRKNGKVISAGNNGDHQGDVTEWSDIVAISAGSRHTVGLDKHGEIHIAGYGNNYDVEENLGTDRLMRIIETEKDEWKDVVSIDAGGGDGDLYVEYVVGLRADGTVTVAFDPEGKYKAFRLDEVENWENIVAISAGTYHIVGLRADGTVLSTVHDTDAGLLNYQKTEPLSTGYSNVDNWNDIVAISAGYGITVGIKSDGSVMACGLTGNNQLKGVSAWKNMTIR